MATEMQNRHSLDNLLAVVACEVLKAELEAAAQGRSFGFLFLDQGLHRTPDKMATLIQEKIDSLPKSIKRVVLDYGLCSNGILGVKAGNKELIVPRCRDCVALLLGLPAAYRAAFDSRPGKYYLTPCWVAAKKDRLGIIYDDYAARLNLKTAFWPMEEELKNYNHIALINTGVRDVEPLRARTRENCRRLKKEYLEIQGSLDYFARLVGGAYDDDRFVIIPPGSELSQEMFLQD